MTERIRVLICGTGAGAHALAAMISQQPDVDLRILTRSAEKAQRWQEAMDRDGFSVRIESENGQPAVLKAGPFTITTEREAARGCDVVILSVPAFAHLTYLQCLAPYLEDGCVIVGLPGQNGFEYDVREALGSHLKRCAMLNFESLPWVCRPGEFGRYASIAGRKERLLGAANGDLGRANISDPLAFLQRLFGMPPKLTISGHPLGITLRAPNAYCHPPMMFGRWKDWDGVALDEAPFFYSGVDEETVTLLEEVSAEVVGISQRITADYGVDLSEVIRLYDWDVGCYGNVIGDKTNLLTAMRTNGAYAGIRHPMVETEDGKFVPDFTHRFLTEDIPFGLVVIRGIAEIAKVPTPKIDMVLCWSQQILGKEYLVGPRLSGKDIATTRCPQRYGYSTMEDVLGA